ncbi:hypothetical protein N7470_005004 [Penicillium chermesinum]|nr:hypothetical protein N7470_005004 [Penicillium chermesinum]
MNSLNLQAVDTLEATVIIDNELDPLSPAAPETVKIVGSMYTAMTDPSNHLTDRGEAVKEMRMGDICCSAHGLSILVQQKEAKSTRSYLTPDQRVPYGERNVKRLRPDLASVERIQLSHWHRDHSGGLEKAINMIQEAKQAAGRTEKVVVDLHPDRPAYRGMASPERIISIEADPTFEQLVAAGATVEKHDEPHTVLDDMFLISGEIPRVTKYETGLKGSVTWDPEAKDWYSDEAIADERFLACNLKGKGLVIFTACSHAGVVNTAKHALSLAGTKAPLHAVIGGFHLAMSDQTQVQNTVSDLKRLDPAVLMPGHCSGWRSKFAIEKAMPGTLVPCTVGIKIAF